MFLIQIHCNGVCFHLRVDAASMIWSFSTFLSFSFSPPLVPSGQGPRKQVGWGTWLVPSIPKVLWPSILASTTLDVKMVSLVFSFLFCLLTFRLKLEATINQIPFIFPKTHIVQSCPRIKYRSTPTPTDQCPNVKQTNLNPWEVTYVCQSWLREEKKEGTGSKIAIELLKLSRNVWNHFQLKPTVLFWKIDHLSVPTIGVAPDINNKARAGGKSLHQAMMRWAHHQIQSLFRRKPV